jgi:hypothetical protein
MIMSMQNAITTKLHAAIGSMLFPHEVISTLSYFRAALRTDFLDRVLFRILVEFALASGAAKIISLSFILGLSGGLFFVYLHVADRIDSRHVCSFQS